MINFSTWSQSANKYFLMDRIYIKGYKWTPFVKVKFRKNKTTLETMHEMVNIQGSNGNWNYDPYMHGLYNGMEFMLAMSEKREPIFRSAPEEWLCDRKVEYVLSSETNCEEVVH